MIVACLFAFGGLYGRLNIKNLNHNAMLFCWLSFYKGRLTVLKKSILSLMAVLPLFGCAVPEKFTQPAKKYEMNWPDKGVKATFVYNTQQVSGYQYRSRCAGEVAIENYGNNNFQYISFNLTFYSLSTPI